MSNFTRATFCNEQLLCFNLFPSEIGSTDGAAEHPASHDAELRLGASPHSRAPPHRLVVIALVFGAIRGVLVEDHVETSLGSLSGAAELLAARDRELGPGGGGIRRFPYGAIHMLLPQNLAMLF